MRRSIGGVSAIPSFRPLVRGSAGGPVGRARMCELFRLGRWLGARTYGCLGGVADVIPVWIGILSGS